MRVISMMTEMLRSLILTLGGGNEGVKGGRHGGGQGGVPPQGAVREIGCGCGRRGIRKGRT